MDTDERLQRYIRARTPDGQLLAVFRDSPKLTPAQRRRLRHKEKSRKAHSHADLPTVELANGKVKRVPCWRCAKVSQKVRRVGGS